MSQDPAVTLAKEAHLRSFAKAVSWRIVGSLDTFVLSFLVTGNLVWAGSIASVETLTKIVLFYLHERVWPQIRCGRDAHGHHVRAGATCASWRPGAAARAL